MASPAGHQLGVWSVFIQIVGGLIIGLMARYGSEKIRGHGIPEALEAILIGSSRMEARVAVLKPLSSALSIGTGGFFCSSRRRHTRCSRDWSSDVCSSD